MSDRVFNPCAHPVMSRTWSNPRSETRVRTDFDAVPEVADTRDERIRVHAAVRVALAREELCARHEAMGPRGHQIDPRRVQRLLAAVHVALRAVRRAY